MMIYSMNKIVGTVTRDHARVEADASTALGAWNLAVGTLQSAMSGLAAPVADISGFMGTLAKADSAERWAQLQGIDTPLSGNSPALLEKDRRLKRAITLEVYHQRIADSADPFNPEQLRDTRDNDTLRVLCQKGATSDCIRQWVQFRLDIAQDPTGGALSDIKQILTQLAESRENTVFNAKALSETRHFDDLRGDLDVIGALAGQVATLKVDAENAEAFQKVQAQLTALLAKKEAATEAAMGECMKAQLTSRLTECGDLFAGDGDDLDGIIAQLGSVGELLAGLRAEDPDAMDALLSLAREVESLQQRFASRVLAAQEARVQEFIAEGARLQVRGREIFSIDAQGTETNVTGVFKAKALGLDGLMGAAQQAMLAMQAIVDGLLEDSGQRQGAMLKLLSRLDSAQRGLRKSAVTTVSVRQNLANLNPAPADGGAAAVGSDAYIKARLTGYIATQALALNTSQAEVDAFIMSLEPTESLADPELRAAECQKVLAAIQTEREKQRLEYQGLLGLEQVSVGEWVLRVPGDFKGTTAAELIERLKTDHPDELGGDGDAELPALLQAVIGHAGAVFEAQIKEELAARDALEAAMAQRLPAASHDSGADKEPEAAAADWKPAYVRAIQAFGAANGASETGGVESPERALWNALGHLSAFNELFFNHRFFRYRQSKELLPLDHEAIQLVDHLRATVSSCLSSSRWGVEGKERGYLQRVVQFLNDSIDRHFFEVLFIGQTFYDLELTDVQKATLEGTIGGQPADIQTRFAEVQDWGEPGRTYRNKDNPKWFKWCLQVPALNMRVRSMRQLNLEETGRSWRPLLARDLSSGGLVLSFDAVTSQWELKFNPLFETARAALVEMERHDLLPRVVDALRRHANLPSALVDRRLNLLKNQVPPTAVEAVDGDFVDVQRPLSGVGLPDAFSPWDEFRLKRCLDGAEQVELAAQPALARQGDRPEWAALFNVFFDVLPGYIESVLKSPDIAKLNQLQAGSPIRDAMVVRLQPLLEAFMDFTFRVARKNLKKGEKLQFIQMRHPVWGMFFQLASLGVQESLGLRPHPFWMLTRSGNVINQKHPLANLLQSCFCSKDKELRRLYDPISDFVKALQVAGSAPVSQNFELACLAPSTFRVLKVHGDRSIQADDGGREGLLLRQIKRFEDEFRAQSSSLETWRRSGVRVGKEDLSKLYLASLRVILNVLIPDKIDLSALTKPLRSTQLLIEITKLDLAKDGFQKSEGDSKWKIALKETVQSILSILRDLVKTRRHDELKCLVSGDVFSHLDRRIDDVVNMLSPSALFDRRYIQHEDTSVIWSLGFPYPGRDEITQASVDDIALQFGVLEAVMDWSEAENGVHKEIAELEADVPEDAIPTMVTAAKAVELAKVGDALDRWASKGDSVSDGLTAQRKVVQTHFLQRLRDSN